MQELGTLVIKHLVQRLHYSQEAGRYMVVDQPIVIQRVPRVTLQTAQELKTHFSVGEDYDFVWIANPTPL